MSKNLRDYSKALYTMDGVVRRAKGADWDAQSPNEEWSARETLGHVIWGIKRMTTAIRGEDPPAEQAEGLVAGDNPEASWASAMENLLEALDQRGVLNKVIDTPFGERTVDDALGTFFVDPLTHAWDVATALGIDAAIPEELADRAVKLLQAAGDAVRGPGFFQEVVDVESSSSGVDRFIGYTGRNPK